MSSRLLVRHKRSENGNLLKRQLAALEYINLLNHCMHMKLHNA